MATGYEMTLDEAALQLHSRYRRFPWFVSVGTGQLSDGHSAIFLYVKSARHPELKTVESSWLGYRVIVRPIGSIKPLHQVEAASYS